MNPLTECALGFYLGEVKDYLLYRELSGAVGDPELKEALGRIAEVERGHALFWEEFLRRRGVHPPNRVKPPLFLRLLGRVLSPALLIPLLELGETRAYTRYYRFLRDSGEELSEEERESLKGIILEELSHEEFFRGKLEALGVFNVRDFVLGMNDGLVELLGVVAGLSAVYRDQPELVGISGLVVGLAGAISMGAGAFVSVRSQRQVNELLRERETILADLKGLEPNPRSAEEESELRSALFTGGAYLFGVVFPVTPFFLTDSMVTALLMSICGALVVLGTVGAFVSLASGIPVRKKIAEMTAVVTLSAAASYLIGGLVKALFS